MEDFEQELNRLLQRFPGVKKIVKRIYQQVFYTFSPKLVKEGSIERVTPYDQWEYFFGYYDKSPWDSTGRYMLCLRVKNAYQMPDNDSEAELVLIDTANENCVQVIGTTHAWNVQQGCMLQWLGPDYCDRVIYNDFRDGRYCAVILNLKNKEEKELPMPVYSVSLNGTFALTLDFSRLHRLRPGYGYCNLLETTETEKCPDKPCIWRMDLKEGIYKPLFKYTDLAAFKPNMSMQGAKHKVNHLMISPDGKRFMVLHRWFVGSRKYTRLLTADCTSGGLYDLLDDGFVSHCYWKNEREILTFAEKKGVGRGYYLLQDRSTDCRRLWPSLVGDGHPSYGPNGKVVTDTYPDRRRVSSVYLLDENLSDTRVIARAFSPFRYDNEVRCDLHPRWSRDGKQICFDAAFDGKRGLYVVSVE